MPTSENLLVASNLAIELAQIYTRVGDPVAHLDDPPQLTKNLIAITNLRVLVQASKHDRFFSLQPDGHLAWAITDAVLVLGHAGRVAGWFNAIAGRLYAFSLG